MILYALTIVVSAFLLFQVQPVIAKIILPWFGGSAAVVDRVHAVFSDGAAAGYSMRMRWCATSSRERKCWFTRACCW